MNQDVKALEEALAKRPGPRGNMLTAEQAQAHHQVVWGFFLAWQTEATPDRIRRLLDYINRLEQEVANGK